jgi:hypothetical protein
LVPLFRTTFGENAPALPCFLFLMGPTGQQNMAQFCVIEAELPLPSNEELVRDLGLSTPQVQSIASRSVHNFLGDVPHRFMQLHFSSENELLSAMQILPFQMVVAHQSRER